MSIFVPDNATGTSFNIDQKHDDRIIMQTSNESRRMDEPFPLKLHRLLEDVENTKQQEIVSWNPDGESFTIIQPKVFADSIMVKYFRQTKYKSFQRQMNLYGFTREVRGKIRGVYSHPQFRKDARELCPQIKRSNRSRPFERTSSNAAASAVLKKTSATIDTTSTAAATPAINSIDCSGPLFTTLPNRQNSNNNCAFNLALALSKDAFRYHLPPAADFSIFATQLNTNNAFTLPEKRPSLTLPSEDANNRLRFTIPLSKDFSFDDDDDASIETIDELPSTAQMNQASSPINFRQQNVPSSFPLEMDEPEESELHADHVEV